MEVAGEVHSYCMMLQVTEHAVVSGDEITAVVAFETFLDLLEVPASWMGAFFPALVKLSVETASNTQLELNTREQALQVSCEMLLCCSPHGLHAQTLTNILSFLFAVLASVLVCKQEQTEFSCKGLWSCSCSKPTSGGVSFLKQGVSLLEQGKAAARMLGYGRMLMGARQTCCWKGDIQFWQ